MVVIVAVAVALVVFAYFRFLLLAFFATTNQPTSQQHQQQQQQQNHTHVHTQIISCRKVKKRQQVHEGRTTIQHKKTDEQNRLDRTDRRVPNNKHHIIKAVII